MLDVEFKDQWVAALRSGKYEQAHGMLRADNTFCCLGVVCDLVDNTKWTRSRNTAIFYWENNMANLTNKVMNKIGLAHKDQIKLIEMNDLQKADFNIIADYIERNL